MRSRPWTVHGLIDVDVEDGGAGPTLASILDSASHATRAPIIAAAAIHAQDLIIKDIGMPRPDRDGPRRTGPMLKVASLGPAKSAVMRGSGR
jgi:hypothetical protein